MDLSLITRRLLVAVVFFTGSFAIAGGMEGGGGKSVVCRNSLGSIVSAEVLDLYEGRIQYGLIYAESHLSSSRQVMDIMINSGLKVNPLSPPKSIYDWYLNVANNLRFVPEGTVLNPINDSLEVIAPKGCAIEQTVNYQNDQNIMVSTEIWKALSETQKAALLIHEAVYRYLRGYLETDSRRARHFTAYLLSGGKVQSTEPTDEIICGSTTPVSNTIFFLSKPYFNAAGVEKVKLQFYQIFGRTLLTKSFIEVTNKSHSADGPARPSFLDQLKNPSQQSQTIYNFRSTSTFEGGDQFRLTIGGEGSGLFMSGTSAIDGRQYGLPIKCSF